MIRITISSSILILVILLIRKCFYYNIPRKMQYALWLALPMYLVLVPFLRIRIPLYGNKATNGIIKVLDTTVFKNTKLPVQDSAQKDTGTIKSGTKKQDIKNNKIKIQNKTTKKKKQYYNPVAKKHIIRHIIKTSRLLYGVICVCIILYIIIKNNIFVCKCLKNRKYYNTDICTGLKIYILENINTPFLLGKSIYSSLEMVQDSQYFHYILLHEYCHWKHKDTIWVIVKYITAALLWYNPLVWAAFYYEECDCELACDEAVMQIAGKDNILQYGDVLLDLALNQIKTHKNIIIQTTAGRGKKMLKERISYIVSKKEE